MVEDKAKKSVRIYVHAYRIWLCVQLFECWCLLAPSNNMDDWTWIPTFVKCHK